MLASPLFLMGFALATLWAGLFHLLFGERWPDLVLYWLVAIVGLWLGQGISQFVALDWLRVGDLSLLGTTLGCWCAMLVARWVRV